MRLLEAALQGAVRAIAAGDVRPVAHDLHQVHMAKEATAQALQSGTYVPPRNGTDIAGFVELDTAFHYRLEGLVEASMNNDVAGSANALGHVLEGCQSCHAAFRDGT